MTNTTLHDEAVAAAGASAIASVIDGMERLYDDRAIGAENELLERRLKKIARQFGEGAAQAERQRIQEVLLRAAPTPYDPDDLPDEGSAAR